MHDTITIHGHIQEGQPLDQTGHAVRVTIIKGGKSTNGYVYDEKALRSIAHMLEGAHAYADHARSSADELTRSVRDVIGFYHDAAYIPPSPTEPHGRVDATLHIMEAADWLWSLIQEACTLGRPELIGLSIDIFGQWQHNENTKTKDVTHIVALNSCDVVTRPSAGGSFKRILHCASPDAQPSRPSGVAEATSHTLHCASPDAQPSRPSGVAEATSHTLHDAPNHTPVGADLSYTPPIYPSTNHTPPIYPSTNHTPPIYPSTNHTPPIYPSTNHTPPIYPSTNHTPPIYPSTNHTPPIYPSTNHTPPIYPSTNHTPVGTRFIASATHGGTHPMPQDQQPVQLPLPTAEEHYQRIEEQRQDAARLLEELRLQRAELLLERRLQESILPSAVKAQMRQRYSGRLFEEQALENDLTAALNMMAQLSRDGIVRGHNYEKPDIGSQITEAEKIQAAFDAMFGLDVDTAHVGNIRGFSSIREAYARVTGDASLMGGITSQSTLGLIRVSESAPITRISEADTTTASFSYLLGTSMNKRLLKDYQAWPAEWQRFVTIAPIRDFKQQTRVRLGAFGSLPIVAEDSTYTAVTLTDSAATYVPQKRGNLVTVSRETIINDDLQAIRQIPTKLAVAAAYTLAEFVYGFLSSNPAIYDNSNLFTSGAPHNNLGASNLSTAAMQAGITAMREQTNYAGKRLGLRPRYLVVPPELEFTAMVATKSAGVPGSNNNDINPMLGYVTPIVSPQLSSPTQWFMIGDPREIDTIEIGFVGGQVNPALFIQDAPLLGLNFTQDAISYKIRHEYGGTVVDYRGLYRGV